MTKWQAHKETVLGAEEPNLPAQSPELNLNQHLWDIGLGVLDLTNTLGIKCEEIPVAAGKGEVEVILE